MIQGIVLNARDYKALKKSIPEEKVPDNPLTKMGLVGPLHGIPVFVKKYQRGGRVFHDRDELLKYMEDAQ